MIALVVRRLGWKPSRARYRAHTLTLRPDRVKPATPDRHRRRGATQARPRRRRTASHVGRASPGWSCDVPGLCRRRVRAGSSTFSSSTPWRQTDAERCSAAPSVSVIGETIDESIAFRPIKQTCITALVRPSDRDTCGLRILMIPNHDRCGARVPSPLVHAWMVLACGMRARSSSDRFRPHAYGHGASAGGECAIGACRSRR